MKKKKGGKLENVDGISLPASWDKVRELNIITCLISISFPCPSLSLLLILLCCKKKKLWLRASRVSGTAQSPLGGESGSYFPFFSSLIFYYLLKHKYVDCCCCCLSPWLSFRDLLDSTSSIDYDESIFNNFHSCLYQLYYRPHKPCDISPSNYPYAPCSLGFLGLISCLWILVLVCIPFTLDTPLLHSPHPNPTNEGLHDHVLSTFILIYHWRIFKK